MEKRYDVFISYSTKDQKIVEGICGFLEREGYRCFVAYRDIPRGVVWASAITDALDASKMMVVVFSNEFNMSNQTDREIEIASENAMPILTYRVADAKMTGAKKYYLKNLHWIDAFPNPENYFGRLLDSMVKLIGLSKIVADKAAQEETERLAKEEAERKSCEAAERERLERERIEAQRRAEQKKVNQLKVSDDSQPLPRKKLWIAIGAIAAVAVLLVLLLKPKKDPMPTDPDTQAYEACQTVQDYRTYLADYGETALHYADARAFIEKIVADSMAEVQEALDQTESQKKEDEAYLKCTSIKGCELYLKAYPNGRYVTEVKDRKMMLEREARAKIDLKSREREEVVEPETFVSPEIEEVVEPEIFVIVEEMPSFPGGEKKMYEFLSENIKYPQLARESLIQGRVFIKFVVEADGSISNVKLIRGIGGGCDEEAMRVVKLMPKWNPGKQRGKPVCVTYTLPVVFKLN